MAISFSCQGCGKPYKLGDEFAGKLARCKQCGEKMRIPAGPDPDLNPDDLRLAMPDPRPVAPARPLPRSTYHPAPPPDPEEVKRPKPKKKSKAKSGALWGPNNYQGDNMRHVIWIGIVVAFFLFRILVKYSMHSDLNEAAEQRQAQEQR